MGPNGQHILSQAEAEALWADFERHGWRDVDFVELFDGVRELRYKAWQADFEDQVKRARFNVAAANADQVKWVLLMAHIRSTDA